MKWPRYTTKVLVDLLLERRRKGKAIKVVDSFHIHNTHFGGSRVLREQNNFLKWQSFLHKSEKLIHIWEKSTHHYLDNAPNQVVVGCIIKKRLELFESLLPIPQRKEDLLLPCCTSTTTFRKHFCYTVCVTVMVVRTDNKQS